MVLACYSKYCITIIVDAENNLRKHYLFPGLLCRYAQQNHNCELKCFVKC